MLVNCPKCGLSQPEDKYCANCGIDMESFKPQKANGSLRFLTHPAFQISGVFLIIFFAIAFIRGQRNGAAWPQQENQKSVIEHHSIATTVPSTGAPVTPPESTATAPIENSNSAPVPPPNAGRTGMGTEQVRNASPQAADSLSGASAGAAEAKTLKLKVILAEVDDLTLKKWASDAATHGVGGSDWIGGPVASMKQKMSEDRSIVTLESTQKTIDATHLNHDLFFGKNLEGNELGFHINITVSDVNVPNVAAHISLVRQIDVDDPKTVEFDVELPPKGGWVLSHLLTLHTDFNKEATDDPKSFFQIFKSERFKSKRSDFTILILFDTDSGT